MFAPATRKDSAQTTTENVYSTLNSSPESQTPSSEPGVTKLSTSTDQTTQTSAATPFSTTSPNAKGRSS